MRTFSCATCESGPRGITALLQHWRGGGADSEAAAGVRDEESGTGGARSAGAGQHQDAVREGHAKRRITGAAESGVEEFAHSDFDLVVWKLGHSIGDHHGTNEKLGGIPIGEGVRDISKIESRGALEQSAGAVLGEANGVHKSMAVGSGQRVLAAAEAALGRDEEQSRGT
uniref:Uncharacterized protein n=1 Tax=Physcomitrium patens TaxID=3218 RepID=A0A7I3YX69_PHYPA